ncbi:helix-loop-helix protein delilah [Drosophila persimilis]|uniref:Helix-loop-helix protein delilah n=2 Tax=pseudoobscura subgroup TaxID=32358 RepID=A0A6I8UQ56_DROPS|nr:helix-loop-helix protein delilah [Drosophila pseudoobscura]XP_026845623.1 helix-loop-helix protein delilah [Drosophila persimilis]
MKSNTYELHNYADLNMDSSPAKKDSRKRKAASARGEKYSLRQKRQKRCASDEAEQELPDLDLELESLEPAASRPKKNSSTNKAKTKAPPLSKYRRKTANARERTRMREINTAFETLRHSVPQAITGEVAANASEKLTKITTLRLAMKYIKMLSDAIEDPSYESEFIGECLEESANREALVTVDSEPELEVEMPVPAAKKPAKSKAGSAGSKKSTAASKRQTQKQAKEKHPTPTQTMTTTPMCASGSSGESCYAASSIGSPGSSAGAACSPSSAYASLSSSASNISHRSSSHRSNSSPGLEPDGNLMGLQGLSDLDTLLLESDGESLHCLSPSYESLLTNGESILPCRGDMPMPGCLDKPDVELSLRLLDADRSTDSFDFASDQQPSACISSLATLDGCYPFGDLLPGDFSDMFLT